MNNYKDLNDYEVMYMIGEASEDAANLLFDKYQPIVEKYAKEYYNYGKKLGLEYQDFVQEGYLGLYSAIKNYTDDKSTLFYTYVIICIKSKMSNLIKRHSTKKNYLLNNSISLHYNYDDKGSELINHIIDEKAIIPEIEVEDMEIIEVFKKIIYDLDLLNGSILELKYNGFNNREISELLDISTSRVSYILRYIRKNLEFYR